MSDLTDEELDEIELTATRATPGPWFVRYLDDDFAASMVAVSTVPDTGEGERWPAFDANDIVAATLIQSPNRYVDIRDGEWEENAAFIATARTTVPRLIDEIRRLRRQIEGGPTRD